MKEPTEFLIEDDPDIFTGSGKTQIPRYEDTKPGFFSTTDPNMCYDKCGRWVCTRKKGHKGLHEAGSDMGVLGRWSEGFKVIHEL